MLTGARLSADEVRRYGAELVILATGSAGEGRAQRADARADCGRGCWSGARPHARADHGRGKRPAGRRVCVYDAEGYQVAAALAEQLASEGLSVELATPFDVVAPACDETLEGPLLRRRIHDAGVSPRAAT